MPGPPCSIASVFAALLAWIGLFVARVEDGEDAASTCGDGTWEPERKEECDDGNRASGDGCSASCTDEYKRVFVSSTTHDGDLGGIAGADGICAGLAADAGLQGEYRAWISTTEADAPNRRFVRAELPYVLVADRACRARWDGALPVLADSWNDLVLVGLGGPIFCSETGALGPAERHVWTDVLYTGESYGGDHCDNWTSNSDLRRGHVGRWSYTNRNWSSYAERDCSQASHLYCFEQ